MDSGTAKCAKVSSSKTVKRPPERSAGIVVFVGVVSLAQGQTSAVVLPSNHSIPGCLARAHKLSLLALLVRFVTKQSGVGSCQHQVS